MVLENEDLVVEVEQLKFIREKKDWSMRTEIGQKKIKLTFDKRIVLNNKFETIPYGFIEIF